MDKEVFDKGQQLRTNVLGADYVANARAATANGFGLAFQDFATEYAWGAIWSRPGLSRRATAASSWSPSWRR